MRQVVFIDPKQDKTDIPLFTSPEADETHDSGVGLVLNNREFAEVLVERNDDLPLRMSPTQNLGIARILGPVTRPFSVVAGRCENSPRPAPDARVEQDPHDTSGVEGRISMRSWATMRRA